MSEGIGGSGGLKIDLEPVAADQIPPIPLAYLIEVGASNLDKKDLGSSGKNTWIFLEISQFCLDPYFVIKSYTGVVYYKSEIIKKNLNPSFNPFKLNGMYKNKIFDRNF